MDLLRAAHEHGVLARYCCADNAVAIEHCMFGGQCGLPPFDVAHEACASVVSQGELGCKDSASAASDAARDASNGRTAAETDVSARRCDRSVSLAARTTSDRDVVDPVVDPVVDTVVAELVELVAALVAEVDGELDAALAGALLMPSVSRRTAVWAATRAV